MTEYAPTAEEVRDGYTLQAFNETGLGETYATARAAFDRWLAAHDREVAARTLEPIRAAEAEWRETPSALMTDGHRRRDWARADTRFRTQVFAALRSGTEASDGPQ